LACSPDKSISLEKIKVFTQKHARDDGLLEGVWVVKRHFPTEALKQTDKIQGITSDYSGTGEYYQGGYGIFFHVYGTNYDDYPRPLDKEHATGALYVAGGANSYNSRLQGEMAEKNMRQLTSELSALIPAGIVAMIGIDADDSLDPRRWCLRYHRTPEGFMEDLRVIGNVQERRALDGRDIRAAVQQSGGISLLDTGKGFLVYSKFGTGGNLDDFYEALLEIGTD
jgi:hypothetical protein